MTPPTATPRTVAALVHRLRAISDDDRYAIDDWSEQIFRQAADLIEKGAKLETELAAAKAEAAHYMSVAQKATDELARLRAEVREARRAWLGDDYGHLPLIEALEKFRSDSDAQSDRADVLYQRSCEVEHALRAEVDALKQCIESGPRVLREDAERNAARAERAEASLHDLNLDLSTANHMIKLERDRADALQTRLKEIESALRKFNLID